MKKYIIYILSYFVSLSVISSCTDNDMGRDADRLIPISFATGNTNIEVIATRETGNATDDDQAVVIRTPADLKDKEVTLFAAKYTDATAGSKTWNFMRGLSGTVNQLGPSSPYFIDYDTVYYSPEENQKYDFISIYPAVGSSTAPGVTYKENAYPKVIVSLKDRPDLMIAQVSGKEKPTTDESITMKFQHQLVLVTFNIYKNTDTELEHNIYLNKMAMKGKTSAEFDPVSKTFDNYVDNTTGATIKVPGYPQPESFLIKEEPKHIRDIFLFPSDGDITEKTYDFVFVLNERDYTYKLPRTGEKWVAGMHYTYNVKVVGSDVYIEVDGKEHGVWIEEEIWNQEPGGEYETN